MSLSRVTGAAAIALICAYLPIEAVRQAPPAQTPPAQAPPAQTPPGQTSPAQPPGQKPPQAAPPTQASIDRANQILAEARNAMGGEKLTAVKTVLASGRTRRVRGDNLVPIEFEIAIEVPDKYVRKDEVPAEESEPTSTGFVGDEIIQYPVPPQMPGRGAGPGGGDARPGGAPAGAPPAGAAPPATSTPPTTTPPTTAPPAPAGGAPPATGAPPAATGAPPGGRGVPPGAVMPGGRGMPAAPTPEMLAAQRKMRLNTAKQDFSRLALGLFAASPSYPLTYSFAARAEAPQGTADVLDVKGDGNFAMRLFIHGETKLPVMVSWQAPPTNVIVTVPGQPGPKTVAPGAVVITAPAPPAATASEEEKGKYAKEVAALRAKAQATPIEYRLYYADYRDVEGVKLPFRLRRAIGTETTEETVFDRFRLNTKIDPRKFTVPQR
jgi:hypothetical protein